MGTQIASPRLTEWHCRCGSRSRAALHCLLSKWCCWGVSKGCRRTAGCCCQQSLIRLTHESVCPVSSCNVKSQAGHPTPNKHEPCCRTTTQIGNCSHPAVSHAADTLSVDSFAKTMWCFWGEGMAPRATTWCRVVHGGTNSHPNTRSEALTCAV